MLVQSGLDLNPDKDTLMRKLSGGMYERNEHDQQLTLKSSENAELTLADLKKSLSVW